MAFTDIFIKRPVLALVVSLLILLIGLKLRPAAGPAIPEAVEHGDHRDYGLSRRVARPDAGLHHHPDRTGGAAAEGVDYITSSSTQGQT